MKTNRSITGYAWGGLTQGNTIPVVTTMMPDINNPGTAETTWFGSFNKTIAVDGKTYTIYRVELIKTSTYPYYREIAFGQAVDSIFTRVSTNSSGTSWGPWMRMTPGRKLIWSGDATSVPMYYQYLYEGLRFFEVIVKVPVWTQGNSTPSASPIYQRIFFALPDSASYTYATSFIANIPYLQSYSSSTIVEARLSWSAHGTSSDSAWNINLTDSNNRCTIVQVYGHS